MPETYPEPRWSRPWLAFALVLAAGCGHSSRDAHSSTRKDAKDEPTDGKTAGIHMAKPERRDIRMMVIQPGTIQAFEVAPIYSRIAGYVEKYNFDIGARVKKGDVLLDMWVPDLAAALNQKKAMTDRASVQIRVSESAEKAAESTLENAKARIVSAEAGVKRRRPATAGGNRRPTASSNW